MPRIAGAMYARKREAMIQQYLPMCWQVARKVFRWPCCRGVCEVEDLYQTGVIGLIEAVDHWDSARPFGPYAWRSIYNAILKHMQRWGLLHMSRSERAECQVGISTQADMTFLLDDAAAEDEAENRQFAAAAMQRIAGFRYRKRQVVELYFGLAGKPPMTLEDVGKVMGISRQAACLQKQDALRRLRDMLEV